jgi:hypothetical protein
MDIEIMIHGVPDGQDYWGIQEEHDNMGLFYDNSNESIKFVVETKKQGDHAYTYYSYLRYKGIIGAGGRPGSYFGLTLRMDKYYQDATYIYSILELVFNKYIVGVLLIASGDTYKYSVRNFAHKSDEIGQVQTALIQLFQMTCVPSKILDIDGSFIHPITATPTGNIFDFNDTAILAAIKKYSKVVLSPDYEMNIEKEYKKKIQDSEGKSGTLITQKDRKISEQESVINSLNATITSQKSTIATLEQEAKRKDSDIQNQKKNGDLVQAVARIKEPITSLANYFRTQEPPAPKYGFKNFILGVACCILTIIAIVLCIIILLRIPEKTTNNSQPKDPTEMTVLSTSNTDNDYQPDTEDDGDLTQGAGDSEPTPAYATLRIDVAGYSRGKLKTNKIYTLTLKNGKQNYSGAGTWQVTNATITGKPTDASIKIQPNGKGTVKLSFQPTDVNYSCESRTFEVESNAAPAVNIVISPNDTEVEIDKEYTFSVPGYNNGEGTWGVDGFAKPTDNTSKKITVKAIDNGNATATISYTPNGGKKVKEQYKYKK